MEKFRRKLRDITGSEDEWMPDPEVMAARNAKDFHYTVGGCVRVGRAAVLRVGVCGQDACGINTGPCLGTPRHGGSVWAVLLFSEWVSEARARVGTTGVWEQQETSLQPGLPAIQASLFTGPVPSRPFLFPQAGMLEQELGAMNPDMTAIEEYRAKLADYNTRARELEEVTAERDEVRPWCLLLYTGGNKGYESGVRVSAVRLFRCL